MRLYFRFKALMLGIAILTGIFNICAQDKQEEIQQKSWWDRLKDGVHNLKENIRRNQDPEWRALLLIESVYGAKLVSPELERYIRDLLHEIGLPNADSVRIRQLSKGAQLTMTKKNACAISQSGLPRYIYVNEKWINTLTEAKKRFLITHEAMHLKCNHNEKMLAIQMAIFCPTFAAMVAFAPNNNRDNKFSIKIVSYFVGLIAVAVVGTKIILKVSRNHEHEADGEAVKVLSTVEGAEALFKEFDEFHQEFDADLPQHPDLVAMRKKQREEADSTHPSHEQRIAYVKEVLNQELKKRTQQDIPAIAA